MGKKKILIVDDDAGLLELVKSRLVASGYRALTAKNGLEGLKKINKESPDLILLDIKMAQMDGYTMLRRLKGRGKTKSIPIIILTAYDKMKDLFELEGVNDYIVKPFDDQDLLLRISRVLKERD